MKMASEAARLLRNVAARAMSSYSTSTSSLSAPGTALLSTRLGAAGISCAHRWRGFSDKAPGDEAGAPAGSSEAKGDEKTKWMVEHARKISQVSRAGDGAGQAKAEAPRSPAPPPTPSALPLRPRRWTP